MQPPNHPIHFFPLINARLWKLAIICLRTSPGWSGVTCETSLMKIPTETPLRGVAVRSGVLEAKYNRSTEVWQLALLPISASSMDNHHLSFIPRNALLVTRRDTFKRACSVFTRCKTRTGSRSSCGTNKGLLLLREPGLMFRNPAIVLGSRQLRSLENLS